MGQGSIDAVVAGTKGFAVALLAPLTARIGNRPRVAADLAQVLGLCSGPTSLAVVEFTGEGSLGTIQAMVRDGQGLRVVAGVPSAHAAADGTLLAMGVEVGRWDGKIDGVISAVDRAVSAMNGAAPVPPAAPAPTAAKPAAPAAPKAVPRPAGAPAAPKVAAPAAGVPAAPASRPAAVPAAPRPPTSPAGAAAPAVPRPAAGPSAPGPAPAPRTTASPGAPPAPQRLPAPAAVAKQSAPAAPRPVGAVPSAAAPRPASQPAAPGAPKVSAPQTAPAVGAAAPPAAAAKPAASPAGSPRPVDPPPPALSRQPAPSKPAPAPVAAGPSPAPASAPAAAPRPPASFFDDLDAEDVSIDDAAPEEAPVDFHASGVYVPPAAAPRAADWPATVCTDAEAEEALRRALSGATDPRPIGALAAKVLESLSELERGVLAGEPQPVETAPIRKATAVRLRVAEALASMPPAGSPVDTAALSAILGQIDGLLAEVAPLLQGAPEELLPALEAVRNALVSEAIDFSEAAQRVAAHAPAPVVSEPRGYSERQAAQARVLTVEKETEQDRADRRRRFAWLVMAAVLLIGAAGLHGYRWWKKSSLLASLPPPEVAGMRISKSGSTGPIVLTPVGTVDKAALERFLSNQELLGKRVYLLENGSYLVLPAGVPPPPGVKQ